MIGQFSAALHHIRIFVQDKKIPTKQMDKLLLLQIDKALDMDMNWSFLTTLSAWMQSLGSIFRYRFLGGVQLKKYHNVMT